MTTIRPSDQALVRRALHWTTLCRDWPEDVIDRLASTARLESYDQRTQVNWRDPQRREVLVVVSGCLEVTRLGENGGKFMLGLLGAGEVTGMVRLLDQVELWYDYFAHEATTLVHVPSGAMRALLDAVPILWRDVALFALARQRESLTLLHRRALQTLQQNLADVLVRLTAWYGEPADAAGTVHVRVSQNDLAAMLGVSRQTTNKELRELAIIGVLASDYGRLVINDMARLTRIAGGSAA